MVKEEVTVEAKRYAKELMEEVNTDRKAHGKKPFEAEEDNDGTPTPPKKKWDNTSKKKLKKRKKEAKRKL